MTVFSFPDIFQAGSSPVSSISGFSVGSGRVDEAVDDFKVGFELECTEIVKQLFLKTWLLEKLDPFREYYACTVFVLKFFTFFFQDTDPFKSKENLFSSSETGDLFLKFSFFFFYFPLLYDLELGMK